MTVRSAPARLRDALARLLPLPLVALAAGCGGPAAVAPPDAEPPSPFADCAALTSPPSPGSGATASGRTTATGGAVSSGATAPRAVASSRATATGGAAGLPDLTLPCFTGGEPVRLANLRGPAVVNLWGSWCEPCRTELPAVQRLADRTAGRLHVIGVDTFDTRDAAGSFAADNGVRFATLYDRDKTLMSALGMANLPATVPTHASQMFSRNVLTLLQHLIKEGALTVDLQDEITGAMAPSPTAGAQRP